MKNKTQMGTQFLVGRCKAKKKKQQKTTTTPATYLRTSQGNSNTQDQYWFDSVLNSDLNCGSIRLSETGEKNEKIKWMTVTCELLFITPVFPYERPSRSCDGIDWVDLLAAEAVLLRQEVAAGG